MSTSTSPTHPTAQPPLPALQAAFRSAIAEITGNESDPLVSPSAQPQFADYQCNAAMSLAKANKTNPRAFAETLKTAVTPKIADLASEITVAGPGFINLRLSPDYVAHTLAILSKNPDYTAPYPLRVVVDYCGVNAAKEMHVGHLRSTIIGDAICRVLELQGHTVIRQNHVGDWGTQFGMLIAHLKSIPDAENAPIKDLEDFYRAAKQKFDNDPAFAELARKNVVALQSGDPDSLRLWTKILNATRDHYEAVCNRLGVQLTRADERGESAYNADLPNVVRELKEKGLAVESDGATAVFIDGEKKTPLIVEKTGGGYLYGTTDLAAVRYRTSVLHADRVLYFVDNRQAQHFAQVFKTAKAAGWTVWGGGQATFEHAGFGTMMGADGKPFKSRTGGLIKLADLLDEAETRALAVVKEKSSGLPEAQQKEIARVVGIGAIKYADLSKDRTSDYVFDWDRMLALDGNTSVYLQYAHARIKSIFRKASLDPTTALECTEPSVKDPTELALAKSLLRFSEVLDTVAAELKPHHLCTYLYDLAGKFSSFYAACEVLTDDRSTRDARLALCQAVAQTLKQGLSLLGIEAPDQM